MKLNRIILSEVSHKTKVVMTELADFDIAIPDWVCWIAQDASGIWWGFEVEPNQGHNFWYENEVGRCLKLFTGTENSEWESTLNKIK